MAAYQASVQGDFDNFVHYIKDEIFHRSSSASLEEEMEESMGQVRCCVLAFERYSASGGNRVSLNIRFWGKKKGWNFWLRLPAAARRCFLKSIPGVKKIFWIPLNRLWNLMLIKKN